MTVGPRMFQRRKPIAAFAVLGTLIGCVADEPESSKMVTSGPAVASVENQPAGNAKCGAVVRAPKWVVGSEWKYSDGYGLKVTEVKGDVTAFALTHSSNRWLSRRGFLREASQSGAYGN